MTVRPRARPLALLSVLLACPGFAQEPTVEKVDDILTIEWHKKDIFVREHRIVFSGGVVARYGPTVVHADTITILQKEEDSRGFAEGHISVDDPEGKITAEYLEFNWKHQTGSARNVTVSVEGLYIQAGDAAIKPEEWELHNVTASPDSSPHPLMQLRSPKVTYRPGKSGVARKASLYALGAKVFTLPSYRFGSKREEQTLRLPSISYNQGFGIGWQTAIPLDDRSRFDGAVRARAGEGPGIGAQVTRSFLPRNEPGGIIAPLSELSERFSFGYFDNIYVQKPLEERELISARRGSIGFGATLNQLAVGRLNRDLYSKPAEVVFEQARPFGGFGFYSSLRFHDIREESGPRERRAMGMVTTLLPTVDFGGGLRTHARIDASGFVGNLHEFGWTQAQVGLLYQPFPQIQLGAAWVRAAEYGKPTFEADRLFSLGGYNLRLDTDFGTTRFSYLTKYDNARKKWFDNELSLSQTIGSIIPYVSYREFPRAFTFGVRLKAEETIAGIADRIKARRKKAGG